MRMPAGNWGTHLPLSLCRIAIAVDLLAFCRAASLLEMCWGIRSQSLDAPEFAPHADGRASGWLELADAPPTVS